VNPFESGGVVIALEMTLGAVVAGPFDVPESVLSGLIQRVLDAELYFYGKIFRFEPADPIEPVHIENL